VQHTNTGHFSEKIGHIPISSKGAPYLYYVLFSQQLTDLQIGDILVVLTEWEATNEHPTNVMMASYVTLADTAKDTTKSANREITEANGFNITDNMHHGVGSKVGTYVVPSALTGTKYVNVVVYAATDWDQLSSDDTLKIEQDYGRLSVIRIRQQSIL
jgi:hypothetical protein